MLYRREVLSSSQTLRRWVGGVFALLGLAAAGTAGGAAPSPAAPSGTFPRLEASFQLPGLNGNPFDFTQNDIRVIFRRPDGKTVEVPAFFDGGTTWRARITPALRGKYSIVRVSGAAVKPNGVTFAGAVPAASRPAPGFVRRDPDAFQRFRFDDGSVYYPIGHNAAWRNGNGPDISDLFAKMGAAGENWSRVWMNHWDGKNLDWPGKIGEINLEAARRWDSIVDAAEKNGIYFQMVLQHHGQYSSTVNPNWNENPWNAKNGGFLATPEEFFTDARARALTRAKYRYILARWGYSPHILAWELFNEVQFTDAIRKNHADTVAAWHREMAEFLRAQDPNHHLITTSSDPSIAGLFDAMDYIQLHNYVADPVSGVGQARPEEWKRPIFYGEFGPAGNLSRDDGSFLRAELWASLLSPASGTAQYWEWNTVDRRDLYGQFRAVTRFVKQVRPELLTVLHPFTPDIETREAGTVSFGPGGGWASAKQTEFTVPATGGVEGISGLPAYLQGRAHQEMFPGAIFHVSFRQPGNCAVTIRQAARAGGHLVVRVDGAVAGEQDFPAGDRDAAVNETLTVPVPAGRHDIRIENTGADWVVIQRISLSPYGSAFRALGKGDARSAIAWLSRSTAAKPGAANESPGILAIPGLEPGGYRVVWWDPVLGSECGSETTVKQKGPLVLEIPGSKNEIAVYVRRPE